MSCALSAVLHVSDLGEASAGQAEELHSHFGQYRLAHLHFRGGFRTPTQIAYGRRASNGTPLRCAVSNRLMTIGRKYSHVQCVWSRSSAACADELFAGHRQDVVVLAEVVEMSSVKLRLRKWRDEAAEEMGKARSLRLSVAAQPRQSTATYSSRRRRRRIYQLTHTRLQIPLIRRHFTCSEKAREKSRATTFGVPSQLWEQGLSNLNREQEGRAAS